MLYGHGWVGTLLVRLRYGNDSILGLLDKSRNGNKCSAQMIYLYELIGVAGAKVVKDSS